MKKEKVWLPPVRPMTIEDAKAVIKKYFKGNDISINVSHGFGTLDIHVSYRDFKPSKVVRDELENMIPYARVTTDRDISLQAAIDVFTEAWKESDKWIVLVGGKLVEISPWEMVYSYLSDKEL